MRLTEQVHIELERTIEPGDTVIDATSGNGHDSLKMAQLTGPEGKVFAIDIQPAAIQATKVRLEEAGHSGNCSLIKGDHSAALIDLLSEHRASVSAITFNLGYLPGSEKQVTTLAETTLAALDNAKSLIQLGGVLLVTAYRGHAGGMDEAEQVANWMRALPESSWAVESQEPPTRDPSRIPPILWIARRLAISKE